MSRLKVPGSVLNAADRVLVAILSSASVFDVFSPSCRSADWLDGFETVFQAITCKKAYKFINVDIREHFIVGAS